MAHAKSSTPNVDGGLGDFFRASYRELVGLAVNLTGSREHAEDAVQEVYSRLMVADLTAIKDVHAYARRAVCNECMSWGRRMVRHGRRARALEAEWERDMRCLPDPFGRVELLSALAQLSPRQRTAVVLRYYLDLPDHEIGSALNCAPATARTLLSRAIRKLRITLDASADEHSAGKGKRDG